MQLSRNNLNLRTSSFNMNKFIKLHHLDRGAQVSSQGFCFCYEKCRTGSLLWEEPQTKLKPTNQRIYNITLTSNIHKDIVTRRQNIEKNNGNINVLLRSVTLDLSIIYVVILIFTHASIWSISTRYKEYWQNGFIIEAVVWKKCNCWKTRTSHIYREKVESNDDISPTGF